MAFSGQKTMATSKAWFCTAATPTATQWTEITNAFGSVTLSGFERQVGFGFVAGQDYPVQGYGKRNGGTVTFSYMYGEGSTGVTGFAEVARTMFESTPPTLHLKWAVAGTASGDHFYTTHTADAMSSVVVMPGYPQGEVGPGDPVMNECIVSTERVVKSES